MHQARIHRALFTSAEIDFRAGLATSVCWPRLWLLLPKETSTTLADARQRLNSAARLLMWGVFFVVWVIWAWWAVPVAVAVTVAAYWRMLSAAGVYDDLLRATFDLHRFALYEQLRWPLPPGPVGEETHGQGLSKYLFRGTADDRLQFVSPPNE